MTCSFTHQLSSGADVTVVYEFVDEDEDVGLNAEFEIEIYLDGLEITNDISAKDTTQIESEVAYRWRKHCEEERREADIARWESQLD
jgi:hypothetical protein